MEELPTIREIFSAAIEIGSQQERAEYLDKACGGDAVLRDEIEGLIKAHFDAGSFLPDEDAPPLAETMATKQPSRGAGEQIGPYKLLQQIGEGGMGSVWMAEQEEPLRRMVALKIIKAGMDSKQVIARFEAERQALALMSHPNIAKVLDAGTTDSGRPYFVMELVKGVPITEFCDKNKDVPQQRLHLFLDVCRAVQHAHQKGVIHRDIKPSNVMVTLHDGVPVVKVIDFGLAKATSQKLTERTLFTAYGQMVGTPTYMSPEQAEMSGLDVDTRTDVYSLGVLLYELMTGTTPIEAKTFREAGFAEIQRTIQEQEAPPMSLRLSSLGGSSTVIAGNRGSDPNRLMQLFRGDLDVIVLKSLEKNRSRRYATPSEFADDVQRFLNHEAIEARPASTAYRLRKLYQRNRAAVLTAAFVSCVLVLATIFSSVQAIRASMVARELEREQQQTLTAMRAAERARLAAELDRAAAITAKEKERVLRLISASDAQSDAALGLLLSTEALKRCKNEHPNLLFSAEHAQRERLYDCPGISLWQPGLKAGRGLLLLSQRKRLLTLDDDNVAWLWDLTAKAPIANRVFRIPATASAITSMVASPDETRIVIAHRDGTCRIWDLTAEDPAASSVVLLGHTGYIVSLEFIASGKRLFTRSLDNMVRIWDLTAENPGAECTVFQVPGDNAGELLLTPDEKQLITTSHGPDRATYRSEMWISDLTADDPAAASQRLIEGSMYPSFRITPDGTKLITSCRMPKGSTSSSELRMWNLSASEVGTESVLLTTRDESDIQFIGFTADGTRLVTRSDNRKARLGEARIWDLTIDDPTAELALLQDVSTNAAVLTPDGTRLITGSKDGICRIWDLTAEDPGARSIELREHSGPVRFVVTPDGSRLITASGSTIRVWNLMAEDPNAERIVWSGHSGPINSMSITPNGKRLITTSGSAFDNSKVTRVWDLTENLHGASSLVLRGHGNPGRGDRFDLISANESRLVSQSSFERYNYRIWDLTTEDPGASIELPRRTFVSWVTHDGTRLVALGYEAWAWDLTKEDPSDHEIRLRVPGKFSAALITPDGKRLITGCLDHTVRIWDLASRGPNTNAVVLKGHTDRISSLAVTPDGTQLVSASDDHTARIWDLAMEDPGAGSILLRGHTDKVYSLVITPDGNQLISFSADETARIWDLSVANPAEGSVVVPEVYGNRGDDLSISPDGKRLIFLRNGQGPLHDGRAARKRAMIWDLTADDLAASIVFKDIFGTLPAITPDETRLITVLDRFARVWNLTGDDPAAQYIELTGHTGRIRSTAITPDGTRLFTGGQDGTVRIWDLTAKEPGAESIVLRGHNLEVRWLKVTPDGTRLITRSSDAVRIWDLAAEPLIAAARLRCGRNFTPSEWKRFFPDEPFRKTFANLPAGESSRAVRH